LSSKSEIAAVKSRYGIRNPYVAVFGGGYEHKNIPRLVDAFESAFGDTAYELVLIGGLTPKTVARVSLSSAGGLADRVVALGHIPKGHVRAVLAGADLFVLPSLYEGFGFPVLEAQGAGVAVVCSRAAALPEVAGTGAAYFDPASTSDMASTMKAVAMNVGLRSRYQAQGKDNVARFSWHTAAREYLAVYRSLAERRRSVSGRVTKAPKPTSMGVGQNVE
jgi:glycosyltransferase involved in cell wall biosynthesis